jgi:hypothetical protein
VATIAGLYVVVAIAQSLLVGGGGGLSMFWSALISSAQTIYAGIFG